MVIYLSFFIVIVGSDVLEGVGDILASLVQALIPQLAQWWHQMLPVHEVRLQIPALVLCPGRLVFANLTGSDGGRFFLPIGSINFRELVFLIET